MSTNFDAAALADWITQAEAARIRGITRQAIAKLIERGRLDTMRVGNVTFVSKNAVEAFEPAQAGRKSAQ